jgi:hypothetical protein
MDQEVFFLYLFSCVTVRQVALFYLYYIRACGPVLTSYIMDQEVFFLYLYSCITVHVESDLTKAAIKIVALTKEASE